jgi:hypothetical protein
MDLKLKGFEFHLLGKTPDGDLKVIKSETISLAEIVRAVLPQVFIVILKDHFNDFEELKVITPVREEALNLLLVLIESKLAEDDVMLLI